jgi:hypothetical protein
MKLRPMLRESNDDFLSINITWKCGIRDIHSMSKVGLQVLCMIQVADFTLRKAELRK